MSAWQGSFPRNKMEKPKYRTPSAGKSLKLANIWLVFALAPKLTSTSVPQQVAVDVLDVGVDGWPAGDAAWCHVGVSFRVNILETFPRNTRAELCRKNELNEMYRCKMIGEFLVGILPGGQLMFVPLAIFSALLLP